MKKLFKRLSSFNWKYALGELLLIVLGILIALYISNLNDNRKGRKFEQQIVSEIEKSLERDFEQHIDSRIDRGEEIIQSAEIILAFLEDEIAYHDSLTTHFWRMNWTIIFEPQTIPFERLKAKGIEQLTNEELRLKLLELYDNTYPRILFFTARFNEWTTDRIEPYCLKNFEIKLLRTGKGYEPIVVEQIRSSIEYRNLVIEKGSRTSRLIGHMQRAKKRVGDALKEIR